MPVSSRSRPCDAAAILEIKTAPIATRSPSHFRHFSWRHPFSAETATDRSRPVWRGPTRRPVPRPRGPLRRAPGGAVRPSGRAPVRPVPVCSRAVPVGRPSRPLTAAGRSVAQGPEHGAAGAPRPPDWGTGRPHGGTSPRTARGEGVRSGRRGPWDGRTRSGEWRLSGARATGPTAATDPAAVPLTDTAAAAPAPSPPLCPTRPPWRPSRGTQGARPPDRAHVSRGRMGPRMHDSEQLPPAFTIRGMCDRGYLHASVVRRTRRGGGQHHLLAGGLQT
jgi:hypothetical protein